jgi:hypothetical protein
LESKHKYSEAFEQALGAYDNWIKLGTPLGQVVIAGKLYSVDLVCDQVKRFAAGEMSDAQYKLLCERAARTGDTSMFPANRSYAAGARCLRSLVQHQRRLDKIAADARRYRQS